jgi:DNA-binding response OmpR family regulator
MPGNSSRPRVLLVEDSDDDAFFFQWTLHKGLIDCEISHIVDGAAAIEYLEKSLSTTHRPDLIFLDLRLPNCSGFEVLKWIRDHHVEPSLDVAVLSGSEHILDIQRAHSLGASAYYIKPLAVEQLRARLAGWHARHANQEQAAKAGPQALATSQTNA